MTYQMRLHYRGLMPYHATTTIVTLTMLKGVIIGGASLSDDERG